MDAVAKISRNLKAAREAKGLSQRALAKVAGVPQSHISKIENAGVDLRVSSLTEIARALDLELTLVPRKSLPVVHSIIRSAQLERPSLTSLALNDELVKLKSIADKIAQQQGAIKEATQLQSRIHDLTRFDIPDSYLGTVRNLTNHLKRVSKGTENFKRLGDALDGVQALRNALAHSSSEPLRPVSLSAYSLEDDDG